MESHGYLNSLWGQLLIEELIRNGLNYFCISPGSRSTPLAVAVARNTRANHILCYDERGAAFHALGYARATGNPAVLICTSGTAVANYYPAVVEAALDRLPLVILSADRPPELRDTGANQTIRQGYFFGNYVKWHFNMPCPDAGISPRMVLTTVDQLYYQAISSPAGPVHLNCPFREPLLPDSQQSVPLEHPGLTSWVHSNKPLTAYQPRRIIPAPPAIAWVQSILEGSQIGVIMAGRLRNAGEATAVLRLSEFLGWPLLADVTSGLRLTTKSKNIIHFYDQILLPEKPARPFPVNTVLQLGDQPVSKRWLQYINQHPPENFIVVQNHPFRQDPAHRVTMRIESDPELFCEMLMESLQPEKITKNDAVERFASLSNRIADVIDRYFQQQQAISEIAVARNITRLISPEHALFVASSMPVREIDMFGCPGQDVPLAANRGASGIDGTIASAIGYAAGLQRPATLLIGDLAFLHDLNSLTMLPSLSHPLTIVVLNNRGGGIFSFLPVAGAEDVFETFFAAPHQWRFSAVADMFSLDYQHPTTNREFIEVYSLAMRNQHHSLIEVHTDRKENKQMHDQLQTLIRGAIEGDK